MTKGCKIWLWIIFIVNTVTLVGLFDDVAALQQAGMGSMGLLILGLSAAVVAGIAIMLFFHRKFGFYILAAAVICTFILNLKLGAGAAYAVGSAVVMPCITYYFILKNKDVIT